MWRVALIIRNVCKKCHPVCIYTVNIERSNTVSGLMK